MKHRHPFIILMSVMVWTAIAFPAPLFGQSVGERVRVTPVASEPIIGILAAKNEGGIEILSATSMSRIHIKFDQIRQIERSLGTRTYKKRGFLIGAIPGGIFGGLVGIGLAGWCPDLSCSEPSVGKQLAAMVVGSIFFGVPFGLAGLAIGSMVKGEKWKTIPTPSMSGRLRISPVIDVASIGGDRRAVLGARIRF